MNSNVENLRSRRSRPRNNGRANRAPNAIRGGVVQERDLATVRTVGFSAPPEFQVNPTITRKVRLIVPYTGAALSFLVTPQAVSQQDGTDYTGSSTARFTQLRFLRFECWFGVPGMATGAVPPNFSVLDTASNISFTDTAGVGVDYAHVAYRPSLVARSQYQLVSSTTPMATITVPALASTGGQFTVDVTVAFD